jgi:hypothetical protein
MSYSRKENLIFAGPLRIFRFYLEGFRAMTVGKTLWKVVLIKLFVMFAILKLFFFSDFLQSNFATDQQRAEHVLDQITQPTQK